MLPLEKMQLYAFWYSQHYRFHLLWSSLFSDVLTVITSLFFSACWGNWLFFCNNFTGLHTKYGLMEELIFLASCQVCWNHIHISRILVNASGKLKPYALFNWIVGLCNRLYASYMLATLCYLYARSSLIAWFITHKPHHKAPPSIWKLEYN
jgi:hypothetical protein